MGFWLLLAILVIYTVMTYNSLVNIKHHVEKSWSNIDVILKQRHDELPKLVETCKQYMKHEQETLEKVTKARSQVHEAQESHDLDALGSAESALRSGLGSLFAVAENYPELKADAQFDNLQQRISALENQIADRREFYNESVNINNVRIQQFPDVIVAKLFGFASATLLQFASAELQDVDIAKQFKA